MSYCLSKKHTLDVVAIILGVVFGCTPWRESDTSSLRESPLNDLRAFRVASRELQYTARWVNRQKPDLDRGRTSTKAEVECDVDECVWPGSNL